MIDLLIGKPGKVSAAVFQRMGDKGSQLINSGYEVRFLKVEVPTVWRDGAVKDKLQPFCIAERHVLNGWRRLLGGSFLRGKRGASSIIHAMIIGNRGLSPIVAGQFNPTPIVRFGLHISAFKRPSFFAKSQEQTMQLYVRSALPTVHGEVRAYNSFFRRHEQSSHEF